MRKLAVVHHRHDDWVPALKEAEPRLEIRGWHPKEAMEADPAWLADAEALFTWRFPEGFLKKMPKLRWVQNGGAGVEHLVKHPDIPEDVLVTRADGQFGLWMARFVCGHLLSEAQCLEACAQAQKERRWEGRLLPEDLTSKQALIVGFGRIGRQIGRALTELGMEVKGFVRRARKEADRELFGLADLPAHLPSARVLVLCAPLTDETRGLVDARLLAHGHGALTFINVGRGDQVNHEDLLAALDSGHLGRAVLDVFPVEPLSTDSPLWSHPRVTITPHHSGPSTPRATIPDLIANLKAYAEDRPIENAVDRDLGY
ncbi:MAG: D-2-hydroxyacid dehydrogenase [Firmicutes bacterium]|nr:D-2-hydroxyacid dehydrogenase [Bacillota bacterium]